MDQRDLMGIREITIDGKWCRCKQIDISAGEIFVIIRCMYFKFFVTSSHIYFFFVEVNTFNFAMKLDLSNGPTQQNTEHQCT